MCRYAFRSYKQHYACFRCRKTFKRPLKQDVDPTGPDRPAKCPECGLLMAIMGLDFKAPRKTATKQWALVENLWAVGLTFHSCGCSGPGYRPRAPRDYEAFLRSTLESYRRTLHEWTAAREGSNREEAIAAARAHPAHRGDIQQSRSVAWPLMSPEDAAFDALLELVSEIHSKKDPTQVLAHILDRIAEFAGAERAYVVTPDREGKFEVRIARERGQPIPIALATVSQTLIRDGITSQGSFFVGDALGSVDYSRRTSVRIARIQSALVVPLLSDKRPSARSSSRTARSPTRSTRRNAAASSAWPRS